VTTEDNEDRLLRSVALQNAESIRVARQRAEQQAEAALRERANLLNLTHDSIFVHGINGAIRYWNRGAEELYGWTAEEVVGSIAYDLLKTVFPASLEQIEAEVMRADRWEGELVHTKKDGSQVVVASRWSLQRDEQGTPAAILETNNDITERKRAEAEARESERALRKAQADLARTTRLTTMGELTASIAHEIVQPLSAVNTNVNTCLHWLEDEKFDLAKARSAATRAAKDADRAIEIIKRVRALMTKSEIQKVELNMSDILSEVLALTDHELRARQVSVNSELAATLPPVLGDRVQLQQLMLNLIMNGIEAMATVAGRPRKLTIEMRAEDTDHVLAVVRDSGLGLDPEKADQIFTPFFTTKPEGTGMGLAICRSIVEAHNGRIWASPGTPHGSVFQFTLPTKAVGTS
jgi:two-component system, LuxR family, sensor kinase FixL